MLRFVTTPDHLSRRQALMATAGGFGYLAFAGLAAQAANPLAPKPPHFKPRAKRVIFLCMTGGPSHVDTFDYKPKLTADDGKAPPAGKSRGFLAGKLLGSPFKFKQHGQGGLWISELFPNLAKQADMLCMLNGMHTNVPAHPQAFLQMHTGTSQFVRPSLGAWSLYGLGTQNENLPGFVSINPPTNNGGAQNYGAAFLPAIFQGTKLAGGGGGGFGGGMMYGGRGGAGPQMSNIKNPRLSKATQREQLDFVQALNKEKLAADKANAQVDGVIASAELAFRMQEDVPKVMDLSGESRATQDSYGIGDRATEGFGRQCLLARRMVEAGVRFVELTYGNWDQHRNLKVDLERHCTAIDKPIAGLLADLKKRGMLDDTLVVWSGEFGRTPYAQGTDGRDHNNKGFTGFFAGGGTKGGFAYGATDEHGFEAVAGKIHTHDFHATILHLLGLDHEKLTYQYAGRDFRLTDVHGAVAKDVLA